MDVRQRATLGRPPPGMFMSSVAGSSGRPISAARKQGIEASFMSKDRRSNTAGMSGLTRQTSAPTLAHTAGPNRSFETFVRNSPLGNTSYDSFTSSPARRRSASATSLGLRGGQQSSKLGLSSSVPRRRPYETSPPLYVTPDRNNFVGRPFGGGFQRRADALQLESRLTERLREHSRSAVEANRRSTADPRRRMQHWPANPWQEDSHSHTNYHQSGMRSSSMGSYIEHPVASSPNGIASHGAPQWQDQRSMQQSLSMSALSHQSMGMHPGPMRSAAQSHEPYAGNSGMSQQPELDDSTMPEARLKIYSDLFEEVIERDRVFGSLLRKIKTAYDTLLVKVSKQDIIPSMLQEGSGQKGAPGATDGSWAQDMSSASIGHSFAGLHSNEPTTRAEEGLQQWEMHRENRVLKDLVERLHLELEEAVKREHRWKQKVVKLKARAESAGPRPMTQQVPMPGYQIQSCLPSEDMWTSALQKSAEDISPEELKMVQNAGTRTFHASLREPGLHGFDGHEGISTQGGLLSMSSISPQNSALPPHESMECMASARSTDSGMLPQCPTRRHPIKPANVPPLDFSRLNQQVEEEEEEEEEGEEGQGGEEEEMDDGAEAIYEQGNPHIYQQNHHQMYGHGDVHAYQPVEPHKYAHGNPLKYVHGDSHASGHTYGHIDPNASGSEEDYTPNGDGGSDYGYPGNPSSAHNNQIM